MNEHIDVYERVLIQEVKNNHLFLYALHYVETNHIQIGFGIESVTGLQRAHIPGPSVHPEHMPLLIDWLRQGGAIKLSPDKTPRTHPFSSAPDAEGVLDYAHMLEDAEEMVLSCGRYSDLVTDPRVWPQRAAAVADMLLNVLTDAFGHPLDWDVRHCNLLDGRFVWMAYDSEIDKIRVGLGLHDELNEKAYGTHTLALGKADVPEFAAFHYHFIDAAIPFISLPPRWPHTLSTFLVGPEKQRLVEVLYPLAEEVWPGVMPVDDEADID